jgi:hypothetical protein
MPPEIDASENCRREYPHGAAERSRAGRGISEGPAPPVVPVTVTGQVHLSFYRPKMLVIESMPSE